MFIGLIILVVLITPFVLNYLYKRTNHYSNQYMDVLKFKNRSEDGEKLQIVNVGSNHPKFGFDYTGLELFAFHIKVKTYNICLYLLFH